MTEERLHGVLVWAVLSMAVLTFLFLLQKAAPYGRHYTGAGWGPHVSDRLGWIVMELPAIVVCLAVYCNGKAAFQIVPLLFLAMWQGHYLTPDVPVPVSGPGTRAEDAFAGGRVGFLLQCD